MATYAALKQRIASEMTRDDLSGDLATLLDQHVADAVDTYGTQRFWFNQGRASVSTVGGTATVATPTIRIAETVKYGDVTLDRIGLDEIDEDVSQGIPTAWAGYDGGLYLSPVPDAVYSLTVYGIRQIAAPALDADDNEWTNEAARLIAAHVRMTLSRDVFRDVEAAVSAQSAVQESLMHMRRETGRRLKRPMRSELAGLTQGGYSWRAV